MKIAVTSSSFSKNPILISETKVLASELVINAQGDKFSKNELIEFLSGADAAIVGLESIDKEVIDSLPQLKFISKYGVGLDNVDLDYCKEKNIGIGWTGGVNRLSVAEMTIGFMLGLARNLYQSSLLLKGGKWEKNGGYQISQKTIGIIGVGYIGKELIRLLKPFDCNILVNDIIEQKGYYQANGVTETSKEEIYKSSDIITIHTPLTELTHNLLNINIIKLLKPNAFVINTARGGIINLDDLKFALQNKLIAGAAIDVYSSEPPDDIELLSLPNLICTPHIGGNSAEAVLAMGRSAIAHLQNFIGNVKI